MDDPTAVDEARLRALLVDLLSVYSPSGKERQAQEAAEAFLAAHGIEPVRQHLDEERYNLLLLPRDTDPAWALVGHMDTVPAYNMETLDPVVDADGETVHGLGAADMKGGCAALLEAFVCAHAAGAQPPAALFLVVGEEDEGDGAQAVLKEHPVPWALVAEPTGLRPCLEHYGFVEIELHTAGTRRHASCADSEHNAVQSMLRLLVALTAHFETLRTDVVFNIRDMHSSEAGFAVPDHCSAWIDLHVPPRSPLGEITAEVEAVAASTLGEATPPPVRFNTLYAGYSLPETGPFVEGLKEAYRKRAGDEWHPMPFRSHSDANLFWRAGVRPVILGPGELTRAHTKDEAVPFSQVARAARIYRELLLSGVA